MTISQKQLGLLLFFLALPFVGFGFQSNEQNGDYKKVDLFQKKLSDLSQNSKDDLFTIHLESILKVINSKKSLSEREAGVLAKMYDAFVKDSLANPSNFQSYKKRQRMLILAWESPTDGAVSFAWLRLPKNWSPEKEYPLYVQLHGFWEVAQNPFRYMSFTFHQNPMTTYAFEDGYFLSPWGRGNQWYHGISKTDVWESIAELEKIVKINAKRKYLCGHSMGGYGTWHIAQESAENWAAIGIHSGALWYNDGKYVTQEYANKLKNMPTYFFWGNKERQLKKANIKIHKFLEKAGNQNLKIAVFQGGHDYNEEDVEKMYDWLRKFEKNN